MKIEGRKIQDVVLPYNHYGEACIGKVKGKHWHSDKRGAFQGEIIHPKGFTGETKNVDIGRVVSFFKTFLAGKGKIYLEPSCYYSADFLTINHSDIIFFKSRAKICIDSLYFDYAEQLFPGCKILRPNVPWVNDNMKVTMTDLQHVFGVEHEGEIVGIIAPIQYVEHHYRGLTKHKV